MSHCNTTAELAGGRGRTTPLAARGGPSTPARGDAVGRALSALGRLFVRGWRSGHVSMRDADLRALAELQARRERDGRDELREAWHALDGANRWRHF